MRPYRASKYITEYYKTKNKLTDVLFDKQIITYKSIGDVLGYTETIIRNAVTKSVKNPDIKLRRAIHIFFDKDFYATLGKYNGVNDECKKECKHPYWVDVLRCGIHSKK